MKMLFSYYNLKIRMTNGAQRKKCTAKLLIVRCTRRLSGLTCSIHYLKHVLHKSLLNYRN